MTKDETIKKFGKSDGYDEDRYHMAMEMAARTDHPVFVCFEGLINLENKGLIELVVPGESNE